MMNCKRVLSLLLCLAMLVSLMPTAVFADDAASATVTVTPEQLEALQNSSFTESLGSESLLEKVDEVASLAGSLSELDQEKSELYRLMYAGFPNQYAEEIMLIRNSSLVDLSAYSLLSYFDHLSLAAEELVVNEGAVGSALLSEGNLDNLARKLGTSYEELMMQLEEMRINEPELFAEFAGNGTVMLVADKMNDENSWYENDVKSRLASQDFNDLYSLLQEWPEQALILGGLQLLMFTAFAPDKAANLAESGDFLSVRSLAYETNDEGVRFGDYISQIFVSASQAEKDYLACKALIKIVHAAVTNQPEGMDHVLRNGFTENEHVMEFFASIQNNAGSILPDGHGHAAVNAVDGDLYVDVYGEIVNYPAAEINLIRNSAFGNYDWEVPATQLEHISDLSIILLEEGSTYGQVLMSEAHALAMSELLDIDVETLGAKLDEMMSENPEEAMRYLGRTVVMNVADTVIGMSRAEESMLKESLRLVYFGNGISGSGELCLAMLAIAYGMYGAFDPEGAKEVAKAPSVMNSAIIKGKTNAYGETFGDHMRYVDSSYSQASRDYMAYKAILKMLYQATSEYPQVLERMFSNGYHDKPLYIIYDHAVLGNAHTCEECGEAITDHLAVTVPAEEATCGRTGLTEGKKCLLCDKRLSGFETVPATGEHSYVDGFCSACGAECAHESYTDGVCHICGDDGSAPEGTGEEETPYLIADASDLYWFAKEVNSGNTAIHGKLTADIVVNESVMDGDVLNVGMLREWTAMAYGNAYYSGTFDGDGHTISGLYSNGSVFAEGLFGQLDGGVVKNLGIVDSYFYGLSYTGAVVGYNQGGTVINCYNSGIVKGQDDGTGGVVGYNKGAVIECRNSGIVAGTANTGGVVGRCYNGSVDSCSNDGFISSGGNYVGGVVGNSVNASIKNCYNTGSVDGHFVGGVVGNNYDSVVTNCYNVGAVSGGAAVCGLVGYFYSGIIENCYNTGDVSGVNDVSDFVSHYGGTIINSYYQSDSEKDESEGTTFKTAEQFASGEVAYLLNGDQSEIVFKQTIGTDASPNFTGETVYKATNCGGEASGYSNEEVVPQHNYNDNGICSSCGAVCPHEHYTDGVCDKCGMFEDTTIVGRGQCGDNLTWVLHVDGLLTISGTGAMWSCSYDSSPWRECEVAVKTAIIEEGVTSIGNYAFTHCDQLTSVQLPNSVTSISSHAFSYTGITSIELPERLTNIGTYAFTHCDDLTSVVVPVGVTSIGGYTFSCSQSLTSVTLPDGLTTIGEYAFSSCDNLETVVVPDSLRSIGVGVFSGCGNLKTIDIPDGVTSIGSSAFYGCSSLTSVNIPDGLTRIAGSTFEESGLESVIIPDGVTSMDRWAFAECTNLTSIGIPDSLKTVGMAAFLKCSALTDVYYGGTATQWSAITVDPDNNSKLTGANIHYEACIYTGVHSYIDGFCSVCGEIEPEKKPDGEGTQEAPYLIGTADELYWFAKEVNSGNTAIHGKLTADIVINENVLAEDGSLNGDGSNFREWTPIGSETVAFAGGFCGAYHTISGLYFNDESASYVGLFGHVGETGKVDVLTVADSYIHGMNKVGGIVGCLEGGTVAVCSFDGTVCGENAVAGVAAWNCEGWVVTCFCTGLIIGESEVGSIVGSNTNEGNEATITNCFYLADSETDALEGTTFKTAEQFASGEVAYLLNSDPDDIHWKQTIGTDASPNFTGEMVYAVMNCKGEVEGYSNTEGEIVGHKGGEATCAAKPVCEVCGESYGAIDPENHADDTELRDAAEASCGKPGYSGDIWCPDCETMLQEGTVIAAGGDCVDKAPVDHNCDVCGELVSICGVYEREYGGGIIRIDSRDVALLKPTTFVTNMGVSALLSKVNNCANYGAQESSIYNIYFNNIYGNEEFKRFAADCLGVEVTNLYTRLLELADNDTAKALKIRANILVLYAAQLTESVSQEELTALLTSQSNGSTIYSNFTSSTRCEQGFMQISIAYGMLNAFAYATDNTTLKNSSPTKTTDNIKNDDFRSYVASDAGQRDLAGMLAALRIARGAVGSVPAVEALAVKGFNHTDFVRFVNNELNNLVHTCGVCGVQVTQCEIITLPAVEPTCTANGLTEGSKCILCGKVEIAQEIIASLGHGGGEATCGSKAVCDVCGQEYGELSPENHAGGTELRNAADATCGADGYSGDTWCLGCESLIEEGSVIYATGAHTGGTATCLAMPKCEVCGQDYGKSDPYNHASTDYTYSDNGNGTHKKSFACCGRYTNEAHPYENGFCPNCDAFERPDGEGDYSAPYLIDNAGKLYWFAAEVNRGYESIYGRLTADIIVNEGDVAGCGGTKADDWRDWTPIASNASQKYYRGTFDGDGHFVSGLYCNIATNSVGLFGRSENGHIKNVGIVNSYFCGKKSVGSILGYAYRAIVSNCYNTGTVCSVDGEYVGGLIGYVVVEGRVTDCYNSGNVIGNIIGGRADNVGGFIGCNHLAKVENCHNSGKVIGSTNDSFNYIGGLIGYNSYSSAVTVKNCYNTGDVMGSVNGSGYYAGGLFGYGGNAEGNYNTGSVTGSLYGIAYYVGGITGGGSNLTSCHNTGTIHSAATNVGGVVGKTEGAITNCYNTGDIIREFPNSNYEEDYDRFGENVGGVVGNAYNGTIKGCYNTGKITVRGMNVGGVLGYCEGGKLSNSYNTGAVTATEGGGTDGGVLGYKKSGTTSNCYYLSGTAAGGINRRDVAGQAVAKSAEAFSGGEVTYLLNGDQSKLVFKQTIGTDALPAYEGEQVYAVMSCKNDIAGYSNTAGTEVHADSEFTYLDKEDGSHVKAYACCEEVVGEPEAHTPAEDDGDCTTDILCSLCEAVTAAGEEVHSFTDQASDKKATDASCTAKQTNFALCDNCEAVSDAVTVEVGELLAHSYADGACTVCSKKETHVTPMITGKSLILEGMVSVNVYVGFLNENDENLPVEQVLENGGVEFTMTDGTVVDCTDLVKVSVYNGIQEYTVSSSGIPAKDMDKNLKIRPYLVVEGEKVYGEEQDYGVLTYANNKLAQTDTDAKTEKLKATLASLLHYGAAAQQYFDGKGDYKAPEKLMNDCLNTHVQNGTLKAEYLNLSWDSSLLTPVFPVLPSMAGNFAQKGTLRSTGKSLILEGAVSINYYMSVGEDKTPFEGCTGTLYQWSGADYDAIFAQGGVLTKENATYALATPAYYKYTDGYGWECTVASGQIPAKELGDTVYAAMVITDKNGNEHCSGIVSYSPEEYAANKLNGDDAKLVNMVKWMVSYGESARLNFYKAPANYDEALLQSLNKAFAAACAAAGTDVSDVKAAALLWENSAVVGIASANGADLAAVNEAFQLYYGGNVNSAFQTITTLVFDAAKHIFVDPAKAGQITVNYGGKDITVSADALKDLQNSTFSDIGSAGLLDKVEDVVGFAEIVAAGKLDTMFNDDDFIASAMQALGATTMEECQAVLGEIIDTLIIEYGMSPEEAMMQVQANAAALYAAQNAVNFTDNQITDLFDGTVDYATIKANLLTDGKTAEGMAQAAIVYGMSSAYANSEAYGSHELKATAENPLRVMQALQNDPNFLKFVNSEQGKNDMTAFLGALEIINDSTDNNPEATTDLLMNGFNTAELQGLLGSLMG